MPRVALSGGAYQARSVIASAQRSLNLLHEPLPQQQGEPTMFAHYPTAGLVTLGTLGQNGVRGIRQVATGGIYAVAGSGVYLVDPVTWAGSSLGDITVGPTTPVSLMDNGNTLVVVDGTAGGGWTVDLGTHAFAAISDPAFYGANRVDYLDGYFLFNKPNTPQFYSSDYLATTFDPTWWANKQTYSDLLMTLAVARSEIWLIGQRTTEVWYDVGAADFPFQKMPGVLVDHGCVATYSVATYDDSVYWLTYGRAGERFVVRGAGYQATRVSTYAIENTISNYATVNDAIGFIYSLGGHSFYVLTFPSADATWVYDITTGQWHEWLWIDDNGGEHRHRANCCAAVNGQIVVGDWQNGNLYRVDSTVFTDAGQPIKRLRSFPHLVNDGKRVYYRQFIADLETGNPAGAPQSVTQTLLSCSFSAPDGTNLASYSNPADTNATWNLVAGSGGEIESNRYQGPASSNSEYQSPSISSADYTLQFRAVPLGYASMPVAGAGVYAIARTTGVGTGYRVTVGSDGSQYQLTLDVEGGGMSMTLAMGTLASGWYVVTMVLVGDSIMVKCQRSQDNLWLQPGALWAVGEVSALSLTDSTWTAAGTVIIGGVW